VFPTILPFIIAMDSPWPIYPLLMVNGRQRRDGGRCSGDVLTKGIAYCICKSENLSRWTNKASNIEIGELLVKTEL
jgi:hypothetical protein